mgnify:CR=1 FL=1
MGWINIFFFDTYAIIEIIKGNPNYERFKKEKIITSFLNIIELHYSVLKNSGKEDATLISAEYARYIVPISLEAIEEANLFRLGNIKKKISTADAVGYILSKKFSVKFLTGDKEFEKLDNVEFVR